MLSEQAKKILDAVDEQRVVEIEKSLIQIPSFTTEETPLARHIVNYFQSLGGRLEVELQEVALEAGKVSHNAVARLPGSGGGTNLLFFGHMDHSPAHGKKFAEEELSGWTYDPFAGVVHDGWIYGKGSQDEKGGIAAFMMAAEALTRSDVKMKGDVTFAAVQGHKRVSSGTLHLMKHGLTADYAINTENSGNMIVNSWIGRSEGRLHLWAKEMHFDLRENFDAFKDQLTAHELLHQIQGVLGREMQPPGLDSWMTYHAHPDLPGYPQFRVERIEFHGIYHLSLELQIRTVPGMTNETIRADLERLIVPITALHPYMRAELEWPSGPTTRIAVVNPQDHPLGKSLARWHGSVTGSIGVIGSRGRIGDAADGSHTAAAGIDTFIYGPGGGTTDLEYQRAVHLRTLSGGADTGPDERIAIDDLVSAAKVYALTAMDICG